MNAKNVQPWITSMPERHADALVDERVSRALEEYAIREQPAEASQGLAAQLTERDQETVQRQSMLLGIDGSPGNFCKYSIDGS